MYLSGVFNVHCYGLGSPSNSRSSRHQAALLGNTGFKWVVINGNQSDFWNQSGCLNEHFRALSINIHDPILTADDNVLVKELFADASMASIEDSLMTGTSRPLLLYLPHVPLWLIDWLLYLRRKAESPTVLIVNNFENIIETQSKEGEIDAESILVYSIYNDRPIITDNNPLYFETGINNSDRGHHSEMLLISSRQYEFRTRRIKNAEPISWQYDEAHVSPGWK